MVVKSLEGRGLLSNSTKQTQLVAFGCWKFRHFLSHGVCSAWRKEVGLLKEGDGSPERLVVRGRGVHSCCTWEKAKKHKQILAMSGPDK